METELDDMRNLGFIGICKESYHILTLHLRLFVSLALTLVLPLGAMISCHGLVSDPIAHKIFNDQYALQLQQPGSQAFAAIQSRIAREQFLLIFLTILYFVFVLAFSLLSTASIVYTVASIYTSKGLSYKKVLSVVPKVWKRLFMTFLWAHILIFFYYFAFFFIIVFLVFFHYSSGVDVSLVVYPLAIVVHIFLMYIYVVYHLASVMTVLEGSYGISAMRKSADLIKGKRWVGCTVILIYTVNSSVVLALFNAFVRNPERLGSLVGRVVLGTTLLGVWTVVTLLGILVQTIVYFVCKSVHNERIDRGLLSEHLDGYLGEYMPLKGPVSLEAMEEAELEEAEAFPSQSKGRESRG